jgi:hypothetical protein
MTHHWTTSWTSWINFSQWYSDTNVTTSKSHFLFPLRRSTISQAFWRFVTCRFFTLRNSILASSSLEYSHLSTVGDCLLRVFSASPHPYRLSKSSVNWGHSMPWWLETYVKWHVQTKPCLGHKAEPACFSCRHASRSKKSYNNSGAQGSADSSELAA